MEWSKRFSKHSILTAVQDNEAIRNAFKPGIGWRSKKSPYRALAEILLAGSGCSDSLPRWLYTSFLENRRDIDVVQVSPLTTDNIAEQDNSFSVFKRVTNRPPALAPLTKNRKGFKLVSTWIDTVLPLFEDRVHCTFCVRQHRVTGGAAYGTLYCSHQNCNAKFKIQSNQSRKKWKLTEVVKSVPHDRKPRQLRRERRVAIKAQLCNTHAHQVRANLAVEEEDAGRNSCGLSTEVPSNCVLRKAHHEDVHSNSEDRNVIIDVLKRSEHLVPQYVRTVSAVQSDIPVSVTMWMGPAVELMYLMWRNGHPISLGVDSTKCPITTQAAHGSCFYYYAVVLRHPLPKESPISVMDMVTTRHATSDMYGNLYKWFNECVIRQHKALKIAHIIIDFNWSTLHACCMLLNDLGTTPYLRLCWDMVNKRLSASKILQVTLVLLGRSHIVKDICGWQSMKTTNSQLKRTWMVALCQLINVSSLVEFDSVFDTIIGLLSSTNAEDAAVHRLALQNRIRADGNHDVVIKIFVSPFNQPHIIHVLTIVFRMWKTLKMLIQKQKLN